MSMNPIHTAMISRFFAYDHLPPEKQEISKPFGVLATELAQRAARDGYDQTSMAETSVAIRKLLEAKDAAVRATIPAPA